MRKDILFFVSHYINSGRKKEYQLDCGEICNKFHPSDPFISSDFKLGSTGLCRNTRKDSLQNNIYNIIKKGEKRDIYIIFYNKNNSLITGILKVNKRKIFPNHIEASKKVDFENIISEKRKHLYKSYPYSEKNPYIIGNWLNFKKYNRAYIKKGAYKDYKLGYKYGATQVEAKVRGYKRIRYLKTFLNNYIVLNEK